MKRSELKRHRAPVDLCCEVCGAEFVYVPASGFRPKACSSTCRRELLRRAATPEKVQRAAAASAAARAGCVTVTCGVCGAERSVNPSRAASFRTCSRRCAAVLKHRQTGGTRTGTGNPNYRHGRRAGVRDRAGEARWYAGKGKRCAQCGGRGGVRGMARHHIVYEQHVRREGGDVWDDRNALDLCDSCHMSHHRRGRVIPLTKLPATALQFAAELLGAAAYDYLRRRYAGEDARVDALLHLPRMGPTAGGTGSAMEA